MLLFSNGNKLLPIAAVTRHSRCDYSLTTFQKQQAETGKSFMFTEWKIHFHSFSEQRNV